VNDGSVKLHERWICIVWSKTHPPPLFPNSLKMKSLLQRFPTANAIAKVASSERAQLPREDTEADEDELKHSSSRQSTPRAGRPQPCGSGGAEEHKRQFKGNSMKTVTQKSETAPTEGANQGTRLWHCPPGLRPASWKTSALLPCHAMALAPLPAVLCHVGPTQHTCVFLLVQNPWL